MLNSRLPFHTGDNKSRPNTHTAQLCTFGCTLTLIYTNEHTDKLILSAALIVLIDLRETGLKVVVISGLPGVFCVEQNFDPTRAADERKSLPGRTLLNHSLSYR